MRRIRLGVNIDHVATLRQARDTRYPDPVLAAALVELAGADQVTVHLREDRRHIQDRDLRILRQTVQTSLNLEMASSEDVVAIACEVRPDMATLVPERREERTTEGGLQVLGREREVAAVVRRLQDAGIRVSLFLNPDPESVRAAVEMGCSQVEIHTGFYADADEASRDAQLRRVRAAVAEGARRGIAVAAGHGLDYRNVRAIARIPQVEELNIGHSIVSRAVFVGLEAAVREMRAVLAEEERRRVSR
ncbi:MAG TPA: pyridoxine 5'-phosphate synthase [Myxococcota bacterium]|nr:pyridoxine 5'-phosphate synthase [Myxococcota bacterium]HQK50422.1 pyridoxine 5'-phosphate synthase [Myxococcota bacterium]